MKKAIIVIGLNVLMLSSAYADSLGGWDCTAVNNSNVEYTLPGPTAAEASVSALNICRHYSVKRGNGDPASCEVRLPCVRSSFGFSIDSEQKTWYAHAATNAEALALAIDQCKNESAVPESCRDRFE